MSVYGVMKNLSFVDWYTLLVGLRRGWCDAECLIEFAQDKLGESAIDVDSDLLAIAGRDIPDSELDSTVLHFLETHDGIMSPEQEFQATEKWRFAHLSWLLQKEGSDEDKLVELQELYSQFGFPDDMWDCGIYNRSDVPPLVGAKRVLENLERTCKPRQSN